MPETITGGDSACNHWWLAGPLCYGDDGDDYSECVYTCRKCGAVKHWRYNWYEGVEKGIYSRNYNPETGDA